jgi:hypothetical protein
MPGSFAPLEDDGEEQATGTFCTGKRFEVLR